MASLDADLGRTIIVGLRWIGATGVEVEVERVNEFEAGVWGRRDGREDVVGEAGVRIT